MTNPTQHTNEQVQFQNAAPSSEGPFQQASEQSQFPAAETSSNPIQETPRPVQSSEVIEPVNVLAVKNEDEVVFAKTYVFEGKEYKCINLSRINDLTGDDLLAADRVYASSGQFSPMPEMSLAYTLAIASSATYLPLEFYHKLPAKEALKVKNKVISFLNN
jgi:hypothetical protein